MRFLPADIDLELEPGSEMEPKAACLSPYQACQGPCFHVTCEGDHEAMPAPARRLDLDLSTTRLAKFRKTRWRQQPLISMPPYRPPLHDLCSVQCDDCRNEYDLDQLSEGCIRLLWDGERNNASTADYFARFPRILLCDQCDIWRVKPTCASRSSTSDTVQWQQILLSRLEDA